jgi:hypothetical protein
MQRSAAAGLLAGVVDLVRVRVEPAGRSPGVAPSAGAASTSAVIASDPDVSRAGEGDDALVAASLRCCRSMSAKARPGAGRGAIRSGAVGAGGTGATGVIGACSAMRIGAVSMAALRGG